MKLSGEVTIEASADRVWEILGHQFANIGEWATPIDDSRPAVEPTEALPGRVCQTGMRAFPAVTERIVAIDESSRTLSYEATGLPDFLGEARNTWRVSPMGQQRARARFDGVLETRGVAGLLLALPLRLRMRRETRLVLDDLKHYAEHGTPSSERAHRGDDGGWIEGAEPARPLAAFAVQQNAGRLTGDGVRLPHRHRLIEDDRRRAEVVALDEGGSVGGVVATADRHDGELAAGVGRELLDGGRFVIADLAPRGPEPQQRRRLGCREPGHREVAAAVEARDRELRQRAAGRRVVACGGHREGDPDAGEQQKWPDQPLHDGDVTRLRV